MNDIDRIINGLGALGDMTVGFYTEIMQKLETLQSSLPGKAFGQRSDGPVELLASAAGSNASEPPEEVIQPVPLGRDRNGTSFYEGDTLGRLTDEGRLITLSTEECNNRALYAPEILHAYILWKCGPNHPQEEDAP